MSGFDVIVVIWLVYYPMYLIRQKTGFFLCVFFLIVLFLLRLPLNLSVICANENQGLAFIWGQTLLLWHDLTYGRGLLYVLLYAIVLKVFGFNTMAIIGIHVLETIISISIGILIYLIVKKIMKSDMCGALSVFLWLIFICTPIGKSSLIVEISSNYNLNEESLCVLFSLLSILCLIVGGLFYNSSNLNHKEKSLLFLAGLFAVCSLMSKASGAVLCIAIIVWFLQMYLFQREYFKQLKSRFTYCFLGIIFSLLFFNLILYKLHGDLFLSWKNYFFVGSYSHDYLLSPGAFFHQIYMFMTRYTNSINNFLLFSFVFLLFCGGLISGVLKRNTQNSIKMFWSFISIWGLGNACVIIVPGDYQPYYYYLIWPSVAIILVMGLRKLFLLLQGRKVILSFVSVFVIAFFAYRIYQSVPSHYKLVKALNVLSVFNQPESFQDPVLSPNQNSHFRPPKFCLADTINAFLPGKNDTFYTLVFSQAGLSALGPLSYIYSKRASPTTVDIGLLAVPTIIETKIKVLQGDLLNRKPNILIVSKEVPLKSWQVKHLSPFLHWVENLIDNDYRYEASFNLALRNNKTETFLVYKRVK